MTTLAANKTRAFQLGDTEEFPVIAADIIYQGAAVGENGSGYARPLVAGDPFLGFAEAIADNSAGAAGAITVNTKTRGKIELPIAGLAITANDHPPVLCERRRHVHAHGVNEHEDRLGQSLGFHRRRHRRIRHHVGPVTPPSDDSGNVVVTLIGT
ncbi:MAG: hypothetical protein KL863_08990 [Rhizobium sp.]|nr:hypothetical protein [Rhizobium sp.]